MARVFLTLVCLVVGSAPCVAQAARECPEAIDSISAVADSASRAAGYRVGGTRRSACREGVIVASVWAPELDSETDYGPRVAVIRQGAGSRGHIVARSRGFLDSFLPRLRVFEAAGRILVMAEMGDEGGSWGVETFELVGDSLREVGILDVGTPSAGDNDQSALEHLRVLVAAGQWEVRFDTVVVERPNQESRNLVSGSRAHPVVFRLHRKKWALVP